MTDDLNLELERWPQKFPYSKLVTATKNFKEDRRLGQGGFGVVYRGFLDDLRRDVAIKKHSASSCQGMEEYLSETKGPTTLSWARRRKIVRGLAYALRYLQEECTHSVVHRDIKPHNVYLDKNLEVKLGDFGLSRLADDRNELDEDVYSPGYSVSDEFSTRVRGTLGYLDPEYFSNGRVSKESDLYGFGIVALQIACVRGGSGVLNNGRHTGMRTTFQIVEELWEAGA
ncbi:L-type lectin-domain containing receptor kinase IX.1 [Acorus calamus]|uniref:L-type lectin-domain containing receptor kinase IX.1 n=1 Tax=Acorus calamus TaxID=4465 RepID=A0AAV9CQX6_ACOCL|nr:L-type lectin-domain containing receptor kinase IX.1 [Acorus calamus]